MQPRRPRIAGQTALVTAAVGESLDVRRSGQVLQSTRLWTVSGRQRRRALRGKVTRSFVERRRSASQRRRVWRRWMRQTRGVARSTRRRFRSPETGRLDLRFSSGDARKLHSSMALAEVEAAELGWCSDGTVPVVFWDERRRQRATHAPIGWPSMASCCWWPQSIFVRHRKRNVWQMPSWRRSRPTCEELWRQIEAAFPTLIYVQTETVSSARDRLILLMWQQVWPHRPPPRDSALLVISMNPMQKRARLHL